MSMGLLPHLAGVTHCSVSSWEKSYFPLGQSNGPRNTAALGITPLTGYVSLASPKDAVRRSGGVTVGKSVLSGLPTTLSVLAHSHSLKEAVFAVRTWQAKDKVSHRGVWEDMGRISGGH